MKKITTELMRAAHKLTREIKSEYKGVDYKFQLGLSIKFLLEEKESEFKMVEIKGTENQVKWANDIRTKLINEIAESKALLEKGDDEELKRMIMTHRDIILEVNKDTKNTVVPGNEKEWWIKNILTMINNVTDYIAVQWRCGEFINMGKLYGSNFCYLFESVNINLDKRAIWGY